MYFPNSKTLLSCCIILRVKDQVHAGVAKHHRHLAVFTQPDIFGILPPPPQSQARCVEDPPRPKGSRPALAWLFAGPDPCLYLVIVQV